MKIRYQVQLSSLACLLSLINNMSFLDKNILKTFAKSKYLDIFPKLKDARIQKITEIVLTFIAIPIFGIFAVSPTLVTIAELRKKLSDNQFVYKSLQDKNANLITLQQKYSALRNDIPIILAALPQNQKPTLFIAQIQGLGLTYHINITSIQTTQINYFGPEKYSNDNFSFTLVGGGTYQNILQFTNAVINFERITTIDAISIAKSTDSSLSLTGKVYFKK